ncbi:hypothetical protein QFC20_003117 [Naganishia adeliensis]|uniref:Uncharacterized protein n=1 Tax=Naganishia adeliensis TaxID=92952 RepID=A0ACC2WF62_9TREE|nr:hypothetical protein QFC20_003117 [Naganishia adeliensis]
MAPLLMLVKALVDRQQTATWPRASPGKGAGGEGGFLESLDVDLAKTDITAIENRLALISSLPRPFIDRSTIACLENQPYGGTLESLVTSFASFYQRGRVCGRRDEEKSADSGKVTGSRQGAYSLGNRKRKRLVDDENTQSYVECASNEENRYAEPVELETIKAYAANPDLLNVIISVLVTRLSQGYPFNIKSLDILIHLLHAHLLPHPAFYPPTSQLYAPINALATATIQDGPSGVAGHVKAKADEFLTGIGYEVRLGSAWTGRGTMTDEWGRSAWMGPEQPSAWESPQQGFSLSTTTVSQGWAELFEINV